MSKLSFLLKHKLTHADAADRVESELRRIAHEWGPKVLEKKGRNGVRHLEFRDKSFAGTATLQESNGTSAITLNLKAHWMISIETTAEVLIEDRLLTVNASVPLLLKGRIRRELRMILRQALED